MQAKRHWEEIYQTKAPTQVSWYQAHPRLSLDLIRRTGVAHDAPIIDIGGGASTLVDHLLAEGYANLTVLDISHAALERARERLGQHASTVTWLEQDVTRAELPENQYAVWHDRAVFHFLIDALARTRYVQTVRSAVKPGGHVIVATFGLDGPLRCSGLDVVRYSTASLHDEFGEGFQLLESAHETHQTPFGTEQKFMYCYYRKVE
ncbi:class I SAM-dependent methyltransferase [Anaerolineae bacterium CFX7]|nr:class I SAM-dependent methyltransferase [Anaerolineae bacterium CFX7]